MIENNINSEQINLKIPKKLRSWAEEYADSHGYTNVQELIRDSLRDKVFSEDVREDYIAKLMEIEKNDNLIGEEESKKVLLQLGEKALEYKKNAKK